MSSVWSYEGMRVVVSGGGGAGMGAAAVTELSGLGAEIHVLDLKEPPCDVKSYRSVDLRDPAATEAAIDAIGAPLHALFNCAGLPGQVFSDLDVMTVNFLSMRLLAELCAERMTDGGAIASISSTAGAAYLQKLETWLPLAKTGSFAEGRAWCEAHPDEIRGGYAPSKEALSVWTMWAARPFAERGVRVNCINPGPTDTPMMPDFESTAPPAVIDLFARGLGRRSTPEEQAYPMIFLNSRAASYISGENLNADGGTIHALTTGQLELGYDPESIQQG
ncbi:MAG: coniferyl-alcohol dehydrogenase [Proteobacteria bacterium]|nr:coniferyl-alcohol dehydrogenase [Pseudomonadota bacterium]